MPNAELVKALKKGLGASAVVLALTVTAWAAGKNLQHYPKDISDEALKAEMNLVKRSLGTNCAHCHQMKPRDMSVDTDSKKIARSMLDMQSKMNDKVMTADGMGLRENKVQKATCWMCHKGKEKPQMTPEKPEDEKRFNDSVAAGKHKRTADAMKKLVETLNKDYFTWKDAPKATCWMCHRGKGNVKGTAPAGGDDEKGDEGAKPEPEKKPDAPAPDAPKPDAPKPDAPKPEGTPKGEPD
jgi:hypothetical protein